MGLSVRDSRGYFGVGIYAGKSPENVGGLWRSAHAFGADLIFTVAFRAPRQATDTTRAARHVPLFEWPDLETFASMVPAGCEVVGVEIDDRAKPLASFRHPERAFYLLGAEDHGLSDDALALCSRVVQVPIDYCLNVATTGAIVLYDRAAKRETV